MSVLSGWLQKIDDGLNPIVVKEMRQAVQSRMVAIAITMLLVLQVGCLAVYLIIVSMEETTRSMSFTGSRVVFHILQGLLLGTCMLLIPTFAATRLASERSDTNVDLLFISSLSPRAILTGKLLAAGALVLLIFSACAPFMLFTYLLRGVDFFSMIVVLTIDFLVVIGGIQFSLFFAAIPSQRALKGLVGLLAFGALFGLCILSMTATVGLMEEGTLAQATSGELWGIGASAVLGFLALVGLLFFWTVAFLSPPSANRALPVRAYTLGIWLVTAPLSILWAHKVSNFVPIMVWMLIMMVIIWAQFFTAISEREQWGARVTRTIPRNPVLRLLAFLFYSGSGGSVLFGILLFAMTSAVCWGHFFSYESVWRERRDFQEQLYLFWLSGLYVLCFCLTAVLIRNMFFRKIVQGVNTCVLVFFLIVIASVLPYIVAYMFDPDLLDSRRSTWWVVTNPIHSIAEAIEVRSYRANYHRPYAMMFTGAWAVGIFIASLPWIGRQFRLFRRKEEVSVGEAAMASIPEAEPVLTGGGQSDGIQIGQSHE